MSEPVIIDAPAGPIAGTADGGVRRLLGVPYAEAPIGPLRFAAPRPRARFTVPFDASRHGATPQRVPLFATTTIPEPCVPGDDTLHLEIFAPEGCAGAPVLFWIHGGGYIAGSPASPWYDGGAFARDGVIVVVASYRLGVDGFGVIPGAPDNRGLRDLILALRWLRDNAPALGGDPERITIAGQSAGGGAVLALLASPLAAGLFRAAVSVSGIDLSFERAAARASTIAIAAEMGVEATAEGFGPRDDGDAVRAILRLRDAGGAGGPTPLGPVHGDDVLPEPIPAALRHLGTDVPLIAGSTADEFDGGPTPEDPERPEPHSPEALAAKAAGTRVTDTLFRAACVRSAAARADAAAGTWLYSFDWPSPVTQGATHCIDVPFLFGNLDAEGVPAALGDRPPRGLEAAMHGDLLAVVRGEEPAWPRAGGVAGDPARVYTADGEAVVVRGAYDAVLPPSAEGA
ncbi:MAG: carboxylesterase family protein [Microbacteriaceae bacterium]